MKKKELIIWDIPYKNKAISNSILYWSGFSKNSDVTTIPKLLEEDASYYREKYLFFIHKLGQLNIGDKKLVDLMEVEEKFSFWWMNLLTEKSCFKSTRIYDCIKLLVLDNYLEKHHAKKIKLVTKDAILAEAIKKCALSKGLSFFWEKNIDDHEYILSKLKYSNISSTIRAALFFFRRILQRFSLKKVNFKKCLSGNKTILLFSYFSNLDIDLLKKNLYFSNQWKLLPKFLLSEGFRLNFIHHFIASSTIPNYKRGKKILRKLNESKNVNANHNFLDESISLGILFQALKNYISLRYRMKKIKLQMNYSIKNMDQGYLWPLLKKDWDESIYGPVGMNNMIIFLLIKDMMQKFPNQKKGLFLYEGQAWEKAFIYAWRKNGHGEIYGIDNDAPNFWDLRFFNHKKTISSSDRNSMPIPDGITVNGRAMRKIMQKSGYQSEYLIDVEAIRYLHLKKEKPRKKMERKSILIIGDYSYKSNQSLISLISKVDKSTLINYRILFKDHPASTKREYNTYDNLIIEKINIDLNVILKEVSLVITSTLTSAIIDVALINIPIIMFLGENNLNLSPFINEKNAEFFDNSDDLNSLLKKKETKFKIKIYNNYFFIDHDLNRWKSLLSDN